MQRATVLFAALFTLVACGSSESDVREISVIHTSDLHARLTPDDRGRGGFAYLAAAIAQERAHAGDRALVLHAGDFVQGTPVSTLFEGLPVIEVGNLLGFDAHTLGNHEFDYGWERTKEFIEVGEFSTLSANVVDASGRMLAEPYEIFEVNGLRVGVIGLVTERLEDMLMATVLGPWRAAPVVETARRYSNQLEPETDLIVVLAHVFDDEDEAILRGAPAVDLIVGGHNHGGAEQVREIDGRLIVKVQAYGRELGRLDLVYDADAERILEHEWRRIAVTAEDYEPEPETARAVAEWEAKVAEIVDQPIGRSTARLGKQELQALLQRIMRETVGADFAYQNSGGIRDVLPEGTVTRRHIWNILPFGNDIVSGPVRGAEIPLEIRNQGAGVPDPNAQYLVATNNFIAEKWKQRGIELVTLGPVLREAVIEWIERRGSVP